MNVRWNKPPARETNDQAFAYLEKALALDPHVSGVWTNLSYAHTRAVVARWSTSRPESLRLAHEAGERAVARDPRSADAHYVLGRATGRESSWKIPHVGHAPALSALR